MLPLTLRDAEVRRGNRIIVGPVNLTLTGSGLTALMGPNGSGKTTLLRLIHGLVRPSLGEVGWNLPVDEARRRQAFVFQSPALLRRTVLDNIAFPLRLSGWPRREASAAAEEWATRTGLTPHLDKPAHVLSGGEKQKLALARALIAEPELLLLDEPTANLDGRSTREIEGILSDTVRAGTRVVLATHNLGQARRLADDVIFLLHGVVRERQSSGAFFASPETAEARAFLRGDILE